MSRNVRTQLFNVTITLNISQPNSFVIQLNQAGHSNMTAISDWVTSTQNNEHCLSYMKYWTQTHNQSNNLIRIKSKRKKWCNMCTPPLKKNILSFTRLPKLIEEIKEVCIFEMRQMDLFILEYS